MCSSRLCDLAIKTVYLMQTEYALECNLFANFTKESQTFGKNTSLSGKTNAVV